MNRIVLSISTMLITSAFAFVSSTSALASGSVPINITNQPPAGTGVTAPGSSVTRPMSYAALGDSIAAGAGLAPKDNATAIDEACDRSFLAYPYLLASEMNIPVNQLACSGAKIDDGLYGNQRRNGLTIPAQIPQAFNTNKPDLITVTIGANDARWVESIRACYVRTCGNRFDNSLAKVYRADMRVELYRALNQIKRESAGSTPPKVLLSGYYSPIDSVNCLPTNRVTEAEVTWLQSQTVSLNQAIRSVIPYFSFASYVPVDFSGHEICSTDPWVQGIEAEAPFHPTIEGQAALADAFSRQLVQ